MFSFMTTFTVILPLPVHPPSPAPVKIFSSKIFTYHSILYHNGSPGDGFYGPSAAQNGTVPKPKSLPRLSFFYEIGSYLKHQTARTIVPKEVHYETKNSKGLSSTKRKNIVKNFLRESLKVPKKGSYCPIMRFSFSPYPNKHKKYNPCLKLTFC